MTSMHADLEAAINTVLDGARDQTKEFKIRFRQLIMNALDGNVLDTDAHEVIELAAINEQFED